MPDNRFTRTIKVGDPTGEVPAPTVRAIIRAIRDAEAIHIAFPRLQRALVVDFRSSEDTTPAACVVDLRFSTEGQIAVVAQFRPGHPPIERFVSAPWGGSTRAFAEQGILPAILNRLPPEQTAVAMAVFEGLRKADCGPGAGPATPEGASGEDSSE